MPFVKDLDKRIMPRVSVILPTYNRAYILPEAVESVLQQTFSDFELIIADDGSTDETAQMVRRFRDPRIRFLRNEKNRGVAAARNHALGPARGEFVAFLDSDDVWMPQKLEVSVMFLEEHAEVGGVFSDLVLLRGTERFQSMVRMYPSFARRLQERQGEGFIIFPQRAIYVCLLEEMPVKLQATTMRLDRVRSIALFDELWRSGEDWEFLLRFTRSNSLGYIDHPLTTQRTMPDSTVGQHKKLGSQCLMDLLIREKRRLRGDRLALAAVRRGIASHAKDLGWHYLAEGDRLNAFKVYLRGFSESGDLKLLARSGAAFLPGDIRALVKRSRDALLG
jgi:glycosyltransferase involved in cell wall biosynthesis